ncbi:MAG TPA: chemotaxis protein CheB [Polyangia bacterium]|nr:chemotaxis protein CheB [Polyangia bacterium]
MNDSPQLRPDRARVPSYVVGIGASAGGLDAIEKFFDNLPKDTGMAFVVVQHLSPDFKSMMDELLARHTELPIHLVEDGMPVEADHVYLIPSKKEMIISGERLLLSEQDRQQERTLPIDVFFRSLAQDCGPRAIAVVLSGGGSDGSRGIADIHAAGGLVVVQDVESAQFDGMPRAAAESGLADWVLPPQEMPHLLAEHAANQAQSAARGPIEEAPVVGVGEVYRMLQEEYGIDFTHYKPSTVTRRIERRLTLARTQDIDEYVRRLKGERSELDILYRDLLIEVTRFFRDQQAFQALEERVLPELLRREPLDAPLRFWVAGCATGEEAYSLAILLEDLMAKLGERPIKIFATDVHQGSLEHATRAIYSKESLAGVSDERLARYFTRHGDKFQVTPDLRQRIVFARHNVIKDAPFTRIDFITCRNLLIYLQPAAQQKVLSLFHFALNRQGLLFLGPSETVGPLGRGYETLDKHWRIYRKRSDARIPVDTRLQPASLALPRAPAGSFQASAGRTSLSQLLGTYDALLEKVMPPSLLINDRAELIHAFGGAGEFLRHRDGRQGLDVLELVSDDLKMVLVGGLKRALAEPAAIVYRNVRVKGREASPPYKITIQRVGARGGALHLLVSFEPMEEPAVGSAKPAKQVEMDEVSRDQLRALEIELAHTKESLQSAIEELETSNEELQSSNEELQTSNEELQSTNEELQSVNEELYTVNAEYQRKIAELTEVTNDMDNLLASTEIGTIFLDQQLHIRKFTPQVADAFNLVAHDIGRPIETFVHRLRHPTLTEDLKQVLAGGKPVERELRDSDGKYFFSRILPYRAKGTIAGVVLTLIDVGGLKAAEDALFHERYLLNSLLSTVPDAIYFKDARGRMIRVNPSMAARLGLAEPATAVGKTALDMPNQELALALQRKDETVIRTGQMQHERLEPREAPGGERHWDRVTRFPLRDPGGEIVGMAVIFRDVTEQKTAEDKIQDGVRRRDQFLAMLSHELRNPLGAIVTATALLKSSRASAGNTSRFLQILERQSEQMARLLDDLLEASRVTQNKIELRREIVDLRVLARDAAESVAGLMAARSLSFTADVDGPPLWIDGDASRLQQIQANLLNNAAKYTPGGGQVRLSLSAEDGLAVIRIKDTGAGIPRDMKDSIFDLFVQSKRTLDRSGGGLGVGLTLVRSLVGMHGGTVAVESEGEGCGSEFIVRLPLGAPQALEAASSAAPGAVIERRPLTAGSKIIVVEDNADSRELLCELLTTENLDCLTAEDGASGLALIDQVDPSIAILDVGLPGMDGFEVARRLRASARHANMYLIALTGYGQAADRAASEKAGFDEHLVKPVNVDDLLRILGKLHAGDHDGTASSHSGEGSGPAPESDVV